MAQVVIPKGFEPEPAPATEEPLDMGLTGSVSEQIPTATPVELPPGFEPTGTFNGLTPGGGAEAVKKGLAQLAKERAAPDTILEYLRQSGYQPDQDTVDWLKGGYGQNLDQPDMGFDSVEWDIKDPIKVSPTEAAWSGTQAGALMGFDDEWRALWGAIGNKIGTGLGMNDSTADFGDIYQQLLAKDREYKDAAYNQNAMAYGAGYLPGALLSAPFIGGKVGTAETLLGRVGQAAGAGATAGAITGAGNAEGGMADRTLGAVEGGALGAVGGAALYPVAAGAGNLANAVVRRVRPQGANPNSGLDALLATAPQDAATMRNMADEFTQAGVDPRLLDVIDESGRRVVRHAGNRLTPAQQELVDAADTVYIDAQDRVANQARQVIDPNPQTARQLADDVTAQRDDIMSAAMEPIRGEPVPVTDDMMRVLSTREGLASLRKAQGFMTEQGDREAVDRVIMAVRNAARVDPRMPPQVRQQIVRKLFEDANITVDIADKFARAMKGAGNKVPGLQRVADDFANTVRDSARQASAEYDNALNAYSAQSGVAEAASGTGRRFDGNSTFMSTPPDQYGAAISGASNTPPIPGGASEASALRLRARDEVVDAATAGGGQNAMRVARQLERGSAQAERNRQLLGEEGANMLERGMGAEVRRVDNTRFVDPRTGSKTAPMGADDEAINGVTSAINAASGGKWGAVKAVAGWLRNQGMKNIDAERLVRVAIDPRRTREAIDYLESKGLERARARGLVRSIQISTVAGRGAGAAVGSEERPAPPNSVRAIIRERQ